MPETTNEEGLLIGVAVKSGMVGVGVSVMIGVAEGDASTVGDNDGIIVAEGLAIPSTCCPLLAIENLRVMVTLLSLLSSVVTVMI